MNLKPVFLTHIAHCQGFDESEFIAAHKEPPSISIRLNQAKRQDRSMVLADSSIRGSVPW